MSEPLKLDEIRERCEKASVASHGYRWVVQGSDEPPEAFMPLEIAATDDEGMDEQLALICGKAEYAQPIADFLAHARTDIPGCQTQAEEVRVPWERA